ncbi:hypothetical protein P280DRAFT_474690 [Massarina eburnea CBS 473.64]|uniref:FHA domain-containing protein n=1 Tax=Massarina eburnea CBS 473.64 TaxID=1395130 RepID=A0A6A6RG07_9PLEO|nr:hypothetical protein P280DRAFT_474690 [Massarina eburnea CBS 473.64]
MSADSATFHITLRAADGFDGFHERNLTLQPGKPITIGRASRNHQKPKLMTAADNAYIDSPVISREHALLTVHPSPPAVYIADKGSMHGTVVNGERLEAHRAIKLQSGDLLQFGADVTRDSDHFVARKYTFEAQLPNNSFAQGFTVPDSDTSDAEDEELVDNAMNSPPAVYTHSGTQSNPLTIDDSEDRPSRVLPDTQEATPTLREPAETARPSQNEIPVWATRYTDSASLAHLADNYNKDNEDDMWPLVYDQESISDHDAIVDDDTNSEISEPDYADEEPSSDGDSIESIDNDDYEAASVSHSEADSEPNTQEESLLNQENIEAEATAKIDQTACRMKLKSMLNHQEQMETPQPDDTARTSPTEPLVSFSASTSQDTNPADSAKPTPKAESSSTAAPSNMFEESFMSFGTWGSPLPPRIEPLKFMPWGPSGEYVSPYTPRESSSRFMVMDDAPTYTEPPSMEAFTFTPFPLSQQRTNTQRPFQSSPSSTAHNVPEIPGPQTPVSTNSSPPQPIRRTKVSIPEIVEHVPQQPLTPTSVSGSLKRKAEVFEEDADAAEVADSPMQVQDHSVLAPVAAVATVPATSAPERPKKRLRTALGATARTVAGLLLPGTALAVGIMTQLPDGFWA